MNLQYDNFGIKGKTLTHNKFIFILIIFNTSLFIDLMYILFSK